MKDGMEKANYRVKNCNTCKHTPESYEGQLPCRNCFRKDELGDEWTPKKKLYRVEHHWSTTVEAESWEDASKKGALLFLEDYDITAYGEEFADSMRVQKVDSCG
jgi:hypothetical protein